MRNKFDLCYWMAKEWIAFKKYSVSCKLESRHEVDFGHTYKAAPSAKLFTHYIAEGQRQEFLQVLSQSKFYSFLIDGSTYAGKLKQELIKLLLRKKDDNLRDEVIHKILLP